MAEKKSDKSKKRSPKPKKEPEPCRGLDFKHFKIALESVQELATKDKLLPISDSSGCVRFVVDDAQEFALEFRKRLGEDWQDQGTSEALSEVRGFFQLALFSQDEERRFEVLEGMVFGGFKRLTPTQKKREHGIWKKKFELIEQHTIYIRLFEREKRLRTATSACIVDVDAELVRERRTGLRKNIVDVPFLRVCLRYEKQEHRGFPFFGYMGIHPWSESPNWTQTETFEFEGDDSDIDFLIRRLLAAKVLLGGELRRKKSEGVGS